MKAVKEVPIPMLKRIPLYLFFVKTFQKQGESIYMNLVTEVKY